jgi:hemolysin III
MPEFVLCASYVVHGIERITLAWVPAEGVPAAGLSPSVARLLSRPRPRLRGVSHRIAFVISVPVGALLVASADDSRERFGAAVFATALAFMFGASALVHLRPWTPSRYHRLIQLDMTAICCCLAGTASAVAWLALHGASRWSLAGGVWLIAAAGIVFVWLPVHPRAGVMNGLYLTGGWYPMLFCVPLWRGLGASGFALLVAGGLCYTVGAIVVGAQRPDPWPAVFGYHEIFHLLVIAAATLHYLLVAFDLMG